MNVYKNLVNPNNYQNKCPYSMKATRIVVHNTANDASARNEVAYMIRNTNQVSFHYAVDDKEVVQGIPENRNAWHAGDGANGIGNRQGLSVEICYSLSGGPRFEQAEKNAAKFIAEKLKQNGWGIDKVAKHQDYSGKYCPHRTLDLGWQRFLNMIQKELGGIQAQLKPQPNKTLDDIAREVIQGLWGNGADRIARLTKAGYNPSAVQNRVNELMGQPKPQPIRKSVDQVAREVINGAWGNGQDRLNRLTNAGYNASEVQARVNQLLGATPQRKSNEQVAREVVQGIWGNGAERKQRLEHAGYNYNIIQSIVNSML